MAMQGADTQALRGVSKRFDDAGVALRKLETQVTRQLGSSPWEGGDAQRFRSEWNGKLRVQVFQAVKAVQDAAEALARNADEQERASSGSGGATSGGSSGPNGGPAHQQTRLGGHLGNTGGGMRTSLDGSFEGPGADAEASGPGLVYDPVTGEASYQVVKVGAEAYLWKAQEKGTIDAGPVHISEEASAMRGAKAEAELNVDGKSVEVKGGAFAGTEAKVKDSIEAGGLGVSAEAGVTAGVGAEGTAKVGYDDGKVSVDLGAKVSVGLGIKLEVKFDVDIPKVVDTVGDMVDGVGDMISGVGNFLFG